MSYDGDEGQNISKLARVLQKTTHPPQNLAMIVKGRECKELGSGHPLQLQWQHDFKEPKGIALCCGKLGLLWDLEGEDLPQCINGGFKYLRNIRDPKHYCLARCWTLDYWL